MNILHLSAADYGGAGIAASRLSRNLRVAGLDSRMVVLDKRGSDRYTASLFGRHLPFRVFRMFHKAMLKITSVPDYHFQRQSLSPKVPASLICEMAGFVPHVIVVHQISHFLSPEDVQSLHQLTGAPVVWYLMDMATFTGGCHYAWTCHGYEYSCGNCPALYRAAETDVSRRTWERKEMAFAKMEMVVVAASSWLMEQAGHSSLLRDKRIEKVLLGVDPDIFYPSSRKDARQHLGLPNDKRIVFVGAQSSRQRRKGMAYLVSALSNLAKDPRFDIGKLLVMTAGNWEDGGLLDEMGFSSKHLGFLHGDLKLASAYQAADIFVCPSIEDSGPMMINESIMCGTPVVAFRMGVSPDLVIPGKTGYIARLEDSDDLAAGIRTLLLHGDERFSEMTNDCRQLGLATCHPYRQASQFMDLFKSMREDVGS